MDLIFQVTMQYCFLHHQTWPPFPVISTTGHCFHFDSVSSFFLKLYLHWSPVAYWAPTDLGEVHLSVSYIFTFSYCSWVLQARILKWFAISFSSGPCFVRTLHHDPSILGGPTWHGSLFHWVRQDCGLCHRLVFCYCGFHSICPVMDKDKRFMKASWWEWGKLVFFWWVGLCSVNL